jgi:DNA-binding NarL/FixJ family response regulator
MHQKELYKLAKTHLSSYEYLIFEMYSSGQKGKEISSKIGKTEKSVNNAICRIKAKLNGL